MPANAPASFRQITDVLSQSLQQAFDDVCPDRYGAPLELQRLDDPADAQGVTFGIEGPAPIVLQVHVTITHVGGNVYDIAVQVEEGPVRRFTYSEPAASGSSLSIAPYLGKKIARHVLDDVEQHLGKEVLRSQMATGAS